MRRILWAFIVLSPFIALAQSYHVPVLSVAADAQLAKSAATVASVQMVAVVHSIQTLLT